MYRQIVLCIPFLAVSACGDMIEPGVIPESKVIDSELIGADRSGLYVRQPTIWKTNLIPVCWEPENLPSQADRESVQQAVTAAYETDLGTHFSGWNVCTGDKFSSGLRLANRDEQAHVLWFGNSTAGTASNIVLNFTLKIWGSACTDTATHRLSCIKSIAVHEFGHALGAFHEQARPDAWPVCRQWIAQRNGSVEPIIVLSSGGNVYAPPTNAFDIHSMMNYCNDEGFSYQGTDYNKLYGLKYSNDGAMSANDRIGFANYYGTHKIDLWNPTSMGPTGNGYTMTLFTSNANTFALSKPDLFSIAHGVPTGSGTVEIHQLTGASAYQQYGLHTGSALPISGVTNNVYGFTLADFDRDELPDLYFFINNAQTGSQEVHLLTGASGYQSYAVHQRLPLPASANYKFALGDFDGDGRPDLFAMRPIDDRAISISVLSGSSNYANTVLTTHIPSFTTFGTAAQSVARCHLITGNFYNHSANPRTDLICVAMDPTSDSTPISLVTFRADEDFRISRKVNNLMNTSEDGRYVDFGTWQKGWSDGTNIFPGEGIDIGWVKRQKGGTTEIIYLDAKLFL